MRNLLIWERATFFETAFATHPLGRLPLKSLECVAHSKGINFRAKAYKLYDRIVLGFVCEEADFSGV